MYDVTCQGNSLLANNTAQRKLPLDNHNWENYNAKRKRPLRSAITARALVTTSNINPRNFGEPSGRTLDGVFSVGWSATNRRIALRI